MKSKYLRVAIGSALSLGGSVHAQTSGPEPASTEQANQSSDPLQTIVVTARRRDELLQDVPLSISAISGADLANVGATNLTSVSELVPNTVLSPVRGTSSFLVAFIRGVGQQDPGTGYEPGVGIYVDDVYLARPTGAILDIFDVERIEVLRGPQGTLYGRNTIGGAIKYITRKLSANSMASVKVSAGTYEQVDAVVTASAPVTDTLRIGGTLAKLTRDGFGKNLITGAENYNKDITAVRFSAELLPTDSIFVRLAADHTKDDSNPKQGHRLLPGPAGEPILSDVYDTRANFNSFQGIRTLTENKGASLLIESELSQTLAAKSITAYRSGKHALTVDFDSLPATYFESTAEYTDRQFSQEIQLTYTSENLAGIAGGSYMDSNATQEGVGLLGLGVSAHTIGDTDARSWAAFIDGSYSLSDTVSLNFGGRFTEDTKKARIFSANYLGTLGIPSLGNPGAIMIGPPNTDMTKADLQRVDRAFTPKLGFGWKFAPDQNLYFSYTEGYKGGMFDPRLNLLGNPTSPASLLKRQGVKPEEIKSYELGLKSTLLEGRLQANAAVFKSDYSNLQIPGFFIVNGLIVGALSNAGKAKISGVELEGVSRLTDQLSLSGNLGYMDAEFTTFLNAAGVNIASAKNMQNAPKVTANIAATYEWPMTLLGTSGGMSLINSIAYKSKIYYFEDPSLLDQDAFTLWNASLVWSSDDKKLVVGLHARNLTDTRYRVGGTTLPTTLNTVVSYYGDPRTLTATAEWRF